jgi:hypothetical protein
MKNMRCEKGYTTITLILGLLVVSIIITSQTQKDVFEGRKTIALISGKMASQYKQAVRALVATDGISMATGTFNGTNWLKDSGTCMGATGTRPFLPCDFKNSLNIGLTYSTVVSVSGTTVTASTDLGIPTIGGIAEPKFSGYIVDGINAGTDDLVPAITQTYYIADNDPLTGRVTFEVSNSEENLEFIKRDGTVLPTADFDWNNNDIINIANLSANSVDASSVETDHLRLTSNSVLGSSCNAGELGISSAQELLICDGGSFVSVNRSTTPTTYNVSGPILNGLTPGDVLFVSVYGITRNRGTEIQTMTSVRLTNCGSSTLARTGTARYNWHDGSAPQSASFAVTVPASGCVRGYTDNGNAMNISAVQIL